MVQQSTGQGKLLSSLSSGLLSLFTFQLIARLLTFGLNVFIARTIDRAAFGVGSVQLQMVCDTILMLSREGFRDACQRTPPDAWRSPSGRARILSISWLAVPTAALVGSVVLGFSGAFSAPTGGDVGSIAGYSEAALIFAAAAGLEVLAEPLYVLAHNLLLIHVRVRVEMVALVLKVSTTAAAVALHPAAPLRSFALGQLAFGLGILVGFAGFFTLSAEGVGFSETLRVLCGVHTVRALFRVLLPTSFLREGEEFDWVLFRLAGTMSLKAVQKFVLEKGETLVLLRSFDSTAWGMYSIVQNLGSLAVRLFFLPVEDMAQLAFSKLISSGDSAAAARVLGVLVRIVTLIGATGAAFGPGFAYTAIHIVYGKAWSRTEMPLALSWYAGLVLALALNGVSEAFVHASATPSQMAHRGILLLPVTAGYLAMAASLAPVLGVRALILANALNMLLRTGLSARHAIAFFAAAQPPLPLVASAFLPSKRSALALVAAGLTAAAADSSWVSGSAARASGSDAPRVALATHVALGAALLSGCAAVLFREERALFAAARSLVKGGKVD